jgi:hypothetical protein
MTEQGKAQVEAALERLAAAGSDQARVADAIRNNLEGMSDTEAEAYLRWWYRSLVQIVSGKSVRETYTPLPSGGRFPKDRTTIVRQ